MKLGLLEVDLVTTSVVVFVSVCITVFVMLLVISSVCETTAVRVMIAVDVMLTSWVSGVKVIAPVRPELHHVLKLPGGSGGMEEEADFCGGSTILAVAAGSTVAE